MFGRIDEAMDKVAAREVDNNLPAVSGSDNGKILKVVTGEWEAAAEKTELPAVTATNNGKILKVVDGAWAIGSETVELPAVTSGDSGKVLTVNAQGQWVAADLPT